MVNFFVTVVLILLLYFICRRNTIKKNNSYETAIALLERGHNVFITGGAGTGKSYILNELKKHYKSRLAITSTTGISALNVNGQTIHSWSGIGIANKSIEQSIKRIKEKNTLYTQILCAQMLAIDEISMLDNKTLDYVNETLKLIRNNSKPFGGIQVLLFGDFFQLPPVKLGENGCDFCFNSNTWKELDLKTILLTETKRQTEKEFIRALNNIRLGFITPEDTQMFKQREKDSQNENKSGILHIFGTNEEADSYNSKCFDELQSDVYRYTSEDTLYVYNKDENCTEIKITDENYENIHDIDKKIIKKFSDDCKAPQELILKLNAKVMLIKNIDLSIGLANGSCGTIVELTPSSIVVLFDNGVKHNVEKSEFLYQKDALPKIKRLQYPLRLAYGITIHKSQGMTFDNLVVNFNRVFSDGQGYVALSRTRTLQGLVINDYAPGKVTANPQVLEFYKQLEKKGSYDYKKTKLMLNKVNAKEICDKKRTKNNKINQKIIKNIYISNTNNSQNNDITEIINSNQVIEIEYQSFENNEEIITKRKIKPISLHSGAQLNEIMPLKNGEWDTNLVYLKAYCYLRDEERTFRLDRIKNLRIIG